MWCSLAQLVGKHKSAVVEPNNQLVRKESSSLGKTSMYLRLIGVPNGANNICIGRFVSYFDLHLSCVTALFFVPVLSEVRFARDRSTMTLDYYERTIIYSIMISPFQSHGTRLAGLITWTRLVSWRAGQVLSSTSARRLERQRQRKSERQTGRSCWRWSIGNGLLQTV